MTKKNYPACNLSHSFTTAIGEKAGNPSSSTRFPICNLGSREHDFWGTGASLETVYIWLVTYSLMPVTSPSIPESCTTDPG